MKQTNQGDVIEETVPVGDGERIYIAHHDVAENGLSVTLSIALSEVTDTPATDLISEFAKHVDPDALDRMFRPLPNDELRQGGPLHLSIEGYAIKVFNTGRIEIRG